MDVRIPTLHGEFQLSLGRGPNRKEHLAMALGAVRDEAGVPTRLHSDCLAGDLLGSGRCDCGDQLQHSLGMIGRAAPGVLLYLRQEERGIGLPARPRACDRQDGGLDTVEANLRIGRDAGEREYDMSADMLFDLGVISADLITNNRSKIGGLRALGISMVGRTSIEIPAHPENLGHLRTKLRRMNHMLESGSSLRLSGEKP